MCAMIYGILTSMLAGASPKVGDVASQVRAKMQRVCDAVGSASGVARERSA